ncbi:Poly-gamma-glutamate biosynthesis protein CapA/YwtB (capsule formation), metallophosphatase superfamily [Bacillus sp. cl95]|uniref:CapA family protein n=1 Tax=Bacillus sp. UNCCL13 TaxID=1502772 RepID=UPI0008EA93B1|nr:CapA family protein [Bacillus sp. UNCCL13]SFB06582.1 Poly-gamma-glutamate biosynthesis protein CapA/YwtB (capsule formation), metallophosphatase superfamily [Bacillus sp. UNCCL13]SFQ87638.1 Poly-gamma-glutamate biosynthesis protein CapA/YwtB (capsule formation), metallophosphatase superfamily [Bacillus sp. cl95]
MIKGRSLVCFFLTMMFVLGGTTVSIAQADTEKTLEEEVNSYIKASGGTITVNYQSLETEDHYKFNDRMLVAAASTIKLPLALFVMKLADEGKIDLTQQLTYQKRHYYGGSGVIQYEAVGSRYTIEQLIEKAMIHSDNIAFIMLKEYVGTQDFVAFMKKIGGQYTYPGGRNVTSAYDLSLYAAELYHFSKSSPIGARLVGYLKNTVYNTTIPKGIKDVEVAHKVGMIPMNLIYNDIAIVFDDQPYTLAVTTSGLPYENSQQVIADIAAIVHKHHKAQTKPYYVLSKLTGGRLEKIKEDSLVKDSHYVKSGGLKTALIWYRDINLLKTAFSGVEASPPIIGKAVFLSLKGNVYGDAILKLKNMFADRKKTKNTLPKTHYFPSTVKQFMTTEDVPVYSATGELVEIGKLRANQVWVRTGEDRFWHFVSFGMQRGQVWKSNTIPVYGKVKTVEQKDSYLKYLKLLPNASVFEQPSLSADSLVLFQKEGIVRFLEERGEWFRVAVGGKVGFVHKGFAEEPVSEPIRLTFAGDAMMDWSVKETVRIKGAGYPFVHVKTELSASDLGIVNLETAVTDTAGKYTKEYNFKSDKFSLAGLKDAGFGLVSLANNHSFDYGMTGFRDTVEALEDSQLDFVGGGLTSEQAYAAKSYNIKGKKVKIMAFSKVLPDFSWVAGEAKPGLANGYELELMKRNIRKEKQDADYVFVYIHWGVEKSRKPEPFQRDWARQMIDSGADGIIGSHPHVLQGFEYYNGKPIAYSIGNFLFPDYVKGDKAQTGLLHLDIQDGDITLSFSPYRIVRDQIVPQSDQEREVVWRELEGLSYGEIEISNGLVLGTNSVIAGK